MQRLNKLYERVVMESAPNIPPADPQNPEVIRMLNSQPLYYFASNDAMVAGQHIPSGVYITYSKRYAQSLNKKYLYAVTTPSSFLHTKEVGNKWVKYHVITKSPIKVKQVL